MNFCRINNKLRLILRSMFRKAGMRSEYVYLFVTFFVVLFINYEYLSFASWKYSETDKACILPKLNPFEPEILHYTLGSAEEYNCTKKHPLIFYTDMDSNLIRNSSFQDNDLAYCCYKSIKRNNDDRTVSYSKDCFPIKSNATKIPETLEFVAVFCNHTSSNKMKVVDMFAFVHIKPDVEELVKSIKEDALAINSATSQNEDVNIIILGHDSISHMNFIRTMPKTYSFIMKNLSGISMEGFTKYGENTLPNLLPVLTGQTEEEARRDCFGKSRRFDHCPFVWEKFSYKGYRTIFTEDASQMSIFNFNNKGFYYQPTDYYVRPLMIALKKSISSHQSRNVKLCYGPRLTFDILMDYLKKSVYTFGNDKNYFYFMWSSVISHDELNNPKMGDELLFRTLQWLANGNYLNNTILILMSDHGMRTGQIRRTYQGMVEERMPFLFTVFPKWFSEKYRYAVENFKSNTERLTTPFDLHETLKDLLRLKDLENDKINERDKDLRVSFRIPRGISLFLSISSRRTCRQAGIPESFCICNEVESVLLDNNAEVISASNAVIIAINNMTSQFSQCATLSLGNITNALKISNAVASVESEHSTGKSSGYIISITATPGNGAFEATVFKYLPETWVVLPDISRSNLYGNQSHCVTDKQPKMYCYCRLQ